MATGTSGTERTIGQLVADATHDLEGIVRGEIALAKAEVTDGAKVLGKGAGLLAGAGVPGADGLRLPAAQRGLGHRRVAARLGRLPHRRRRSCCIVAAVLALLGKKALEKAQPGAGARHRPGPADHRRDQGAVRRARMPSTTAATAGARRPRRRRPAPRHPRTAAARHPGATVGRRRHPTPRQPDEALPGRHGPRREHPAAQHRRDLVEGERVAGVRVVERGREDHADHVTAPVDHRPAGGPAAHLGAQRVDLRG